jgi:hypothetical protein
MFPHHVQELTALRKRAHEQLAAMQPTITSLFRRRVSTGAGAKSGAGPDGGAGRRSLLLLLPAPAPPHCGHRGMRRPSGRPRCRFIRRE